MKKNNSILEAARNQIFIAFNTNGNGKQLYHDFNHTLQVALAAREIAVGSKMSEEDVLDLEVAAWFHDAGFVGTGDNHEDIGAAMVAAFLKNYDFPSERIERIQGAIMATKMPQKPQTLFEKVLCDADLHYVGTKSYQDISTLLRVEWEFNLGRIYTEIDWVDSQVAFLTSHKFHTEYAQLKFSRRKNKNISQLNESLKILRKVGNPEEEKEVAKAAKLKKQQDKETKPDRGVETMFRVTNRNHMELSGMADNKANIMISINALIISIVVSAMVPKLDKNVMLIIPTFMLLVTCLVTIIYATLSTRPKITGGTFTSDDLRNRRVNLLFFGNFHRMRFEEFQDGMEEMMLDKQFLYGTMIKDIYSLGQVLGKKYRLIRTSYNVFMYGLILSVLAFAFAFYLWGGIDPVNP